MQDIAINLFEEINRLRSDPEAYKDIVDDYSDVATDEIDLFESINAPYVYNEGLSRGGRHYLNEKGSCGTNGDAYGFSF